MPRRRTGTPPDAEGIVHLTRQLGGVLADLELSEIEISVGETRIRLSRGVGATHPAAGVMPGPSVASVPAPTAAETRAGGLVPVEAPMVGTFYRASSPTAEPYVREGDLVKEGQILCIIEAMKLMNEIESKVAGRIATIFAENGQAVEYGQPLFLIEPTR